MFLKTSRYAGLPPIESKLADGTRCNAVPLRTVPATIGDLVPITGNDRLDVIAERVFADATRAWHVADANSALDARELLVAWLANDEYAQQIAIVVPES